MSVDSETSVAAKHREVIAAIRECADAAYVLSHAWRNLGDRYLDEAPESVSTWSIQGPAQRFAEAQATMERKRDELRELARRR